MVLQASQSRHIFIAMSDKSDPCPGWRRGSAGQTGSDASAIEAFVSRARALAPAGDGGRLIPGARRDDEPAADLGSGLRAAGRDVRRRRQGRHARRAARLFSRARRMPVVRNSSTTPMLEAADDGHRLPRRPHPDRQGAGACAERRAGAARSVRWSISATRWRRASTIWPTRPAAWPARRSCLRLPGGQDAIAEKRLQGDRAAVQRAHGSASTAILPRRWRDCCRRSRCSRPAALKALEARGRPEDRLMIEHHAGRRKMMSVVIGFVVVRLLLLVAFCAAPTAFAARIDAACLGPVLLACRSRWCWCSPGAASAACSVARRSAWYAARMRADARAEAQAPRQALDGAHRGARNGTRSRDRRHWKAWCWPAAAKARCSAR